MLNKKLRSYGVRLNVQIRFEFLMYSISNSNNQIYVAALSES